MSIFIFSVCKVVGFLQFYSTTVSISSIVVLTLDRWVAVTRPFKYNTWVTNRTSYLCIAAIWIIVFVIDIPMTTSIGDFYYMDHVFVCSPKWDVNLTYTLILICIFILPSFTVVIVLNIRLFRVSRSHIDRLSTIQNQVNAPLPRISTTKTKFVVLAIVLTFEISWCPFVIVEILKLLNVTTFSYNTVFLVSWIAVANSFMNSIIYTCLNRKFRKGIKKLFKVKPKTEQYGTESFLQRNPSL